jgi:hypothetical protein
MNSSEMEMASWVSDEGRVPMHLLFAVLAMRASMLLATSRKRVRLSFLLQILTLELSPCRHCDLSFDGSACKGSGKSVSTFIMPVHLPSGAGAVVD